MSERMVEVHNLQKKFIDDTGAFDVLRDTTFTIAKGEMVALVGISGAGKTTLLQILGGLDSYTGGSVIVGGKSLGTMSQKELAAFRNRQIGFVFQFHHLLPDFTALENVIIPAMIAGVPKPDCIKKAMRLLEIFGLAARKSHFPAELSGGERQRAALARALINDPALVLADEPTGNLDKANGEMLLRHFHQANEELKQTFLVATHNTQLTSGMNRVLYLEDGVILDGEGRAGPDK